MHAERRLSSSSSERGWGGTLGWLVSQAYPDLYFSQFEACHSRGSSCGQSRITRRAYENLFYVEMMNDAYDLWSDLEKESGVTLYK